MYLGIIRKTFLVIILVFPQYLASVKSTNLNEFQFNKNSDNLLISGWKPSKDQNNKGNKASEKTIKALNKFKKMS